MADDISAEPTSCSALRIEALINVESVAALAFYYREIERTFASELGRRHQLFEALGAIGRALTAMHSQLSKTPRNSHII